MAMEVEFKTEKMDIPNGNGVRFFKMRKSTSNPDQFIEIQKVDYYNIDNIPESDFFENILPVEYGLVKYPENCLIYKREELVSFENLECFFYDENHHTGKRVHCYFPEKVSEFFIETETRFSFGKDFIFQFPKSKLPVFANDFADWLFPYSQRCFCHLVGGQEILKHCSPDRLEKLKLDL